MGIGREEVDHVARLARLELSEEEKQLFEKQLSGILEHADRVTALDTDGVPPTSHAIPLSNVFRQDVERDCLSQEQALANAPQPESGFFRVPKIIEDEE